MTYSIVDDPSHGKIAFDSSTGKLTYTPDSNFAGQDSLTYKATDQKGLDSNTAEVEIKVNGEVKKSSLSVDESAKAGAALTMVHLWLIAIPRLMSVQIVQ